MHIRYFAALTNLNGQMTVYHRIDFYVSITSPVERDSIAIVEDEEDLAYFFKEALLGNGFKVTAFTDSTSAFEHIYLHHLEYNLILSDLRMPRINGLELIRRISKIDSSIKFILMSAFDPPDISSDSPGAPYEFIQKPVSIGKLQEIVYRNAFAKIIEDY